jgi:hypothetical protein
MSQFDPTQRRETLVLINTGNIGRDNKPTYKLANYVLVEYDGSVDRLLEPRPHIPKFHDDIGGNIVAPESDGTLIHGFEIVDSPWIRDVNGAELHYFGQ